MAEAMIFECRIYDFLNRVYIYSVYVEFPGYGVLVNDIYAKLNRIIQRTYIVIILCEGEGVATR